MQVFFLQFSPLIVPYLESCGLASSVHESAMYFLCSCIPHPFLSVSFFFPGPISKLRFLKIKIKQQEWVGEWVPLLGKWCWINHYTYILKNMIVLQLAIGPVLTIKPNSNHLYRDTGQRLVNFKSNYWKDLCSISASGISRKNVSQMYNDGKLLPIRIHSTNMNQY